MVRKHAFLLIVLSVALNIGFAGIWAAQTTARYWPCSDRCSTGECSGAVSCPLHRRLGVTDGQWQTIEPRMMEFQRNAQALCQEIRGMRTELIDLIASNEPNQAAITAKQEQILTGQRRMQRLVIERLLAEKAVLTAEQQRSLFDMIRRHSAGIGPALMQDDLKEPSHTSAGGGPGDAK